MEELKAKYKELSEAFEEKYHDVIVKMAEKNGVDMGLGVDMLKAVARVEKNPILKEEKGYVDYSEGIEINKEELVKDYTEMEEISKQILNG